MHPKTYLLCDKVFKLDVGGLVTICEVIKNTRETLLVLVKPYSGGPPRHCTQTQQGQVRVSTCGLVSIIGTAGLTKATWST